MGLKKPATHEPLREVVERAHVRDLAGLAVQLREGSAEQRRWAARDLAGQADAMALLGERLLAEREVRVREALLTSLTATPCEATVAALLPLLRSEDAQLRNGAIEALSSMPQAVGPRIARLLEDADADVRIFTVNLLGDLRHPLVLGWLADVLRLESQVNVVAAAIEVLAEAGGPEQLPALQAARQRFEHDPFIGFAADLAARRMGSA